MKTVKTGVKILDVNTSSGDVVVNFEVHLKNDKNLSAKKAESFNLNLGKVTLDEMKERLLEQAEYIISQKDYKVPTNIKSLVGKFITKEVIKNDASNTFE